jgi:hypothetical protein
MRASMPARPSSPQISSISAMSDSLGGQLRAIAMLKSSGAERM